MVDDDNFEAESLYKLRERLSQKSYKLISESKMAEEQFRFLDEILNAIKTKQFAKIIQMKEAMERVVNGILSIDPSAESLLNELFIYAKDKCKMIARDYPSLLEEACRKENVELDNTSIHPKYKFCSGFIILEIDDRLYVAKCSTREGDLFSIPFDIQQVIAKLKNEIKRIFNRGINPKKFLEKLFHNYEKIVQKENRILGDQIPIRKITTRLGKVQRNFRTDEFIVDLSELINKGISNVDGYILGLTQTKDIRAGILLYGLESSGYVGFISFKKEVKK